MKTVDGFELVAECQFYQENSLQVYRSCNTGLHVIIANVDGPVVNGYFTVATEATSDDGLPHTLEHLIFLGSEQYPYKGVLDLVANRCLANGTNAWTATDHTAYTIKTVGSEGFLNLLPIYLDHILYPTLTEAGFVTEVYHINGEGADAGVVYSEMQARENNADIRTYNELMPILYPGNSGYQYETGGIMSNLRDSTSIEKIRDFHKAMYRPENLYVIMTGQLNPHHVFRVLKPFEERIISKGKGELFTRPWQSPVPPFSHSITKNILYPSDSEDNGKVCAAWRGPSIVHGLEESVALEVLLEYLTHSSISPLPRAFVEREDPFASEVSFYFLNHSETGIALFFEGVPYAKITQIEALLKECLQRVASGSPHFDLEEMKSMINNEILEENNKMETEPHHALADSIVKYILYGNDASYLRDTVNRQGALENLYKKDIAFWTELLTKYMLEKPRVVINAMPSIQAGEKLKEELKARVEGRKSSLGAEGLLKLQKKLEDSQQINEIPAPDEILQSVPVASPDGISFHTLSMYSNLTNLDHPTSPCPFLNVQEVPFKIELDHLKSNFVQFTAKIDLSSLSPEQKLYLPLLSELLLESPIKRGPDLDSVISYEEVIKQLNVDTLYVTTLNGLNFHSTRPFGFGNYSSNLAINMKVSINNCIKGIQWLKDILFNVVMDADRVKVKIQKLINSIGEHKRDGTKMVRLLINKIVFSKDAVVNRGDFLVQENFLNKLLQNVLTDPSDTLASLSEIYKKITLFDSFSLHLAADLQQLTSSIDLLKHLKNLAPSSYFQNHQFNLSAIPDSVERRSSTTESTSKGYIIALGSIESSYFHQSIPSIEDFSHEDIPALMVAIVYFIQLEGPMWKQVRGQGFAYHYLLRLKPSDGTLSLIIERAAQLVEAYRVILEILQSYLSGSTAWNQLLYESAKSTLIYEIIEREAHISDVVQQSLLSYYRNVPHDYNRNLVKKISSVTLESMKAAAIKYMTPLLSPNKTCTAVVCQASQETSIQDGLQSLDLNLEIVENLTDCWISQI